MLKYIFANERGYRGSDLTLVLWIRIHTIKNWKKDSTDRQNVSVQVQIFLDVPVVLYIF